MEPQQDIHVCRMSVGPQLAVHATCHGTPGIISQDGPYFRHVAMKQTRRYHSLIGYAGVSSTCNDVLQLNTPVLNGCNLRDKLIYKQGKGRVRLHNQSPLNRQLPVEKAGNLIAHSPIWYIISAYFISLRRQGHT